MLRYIRMFKLASEIQKIKMSILILHVLVKISVTTESNH